MFVSKLLNNLFFNTNNTTLKDLEQFSFTNKNYQNILEDLNHQKFEIETSENLNIHGESSEDVIQLIPLQNFKEINYQKEEEEKEEKEKERYIFVLVQF